MIRRPKLDSGDDLLEAQRKFLESKQSPSARVVRSAARHAEARDDAAAAEPKRDVVQIGKLPTQPPLVLPRVSEEKGPNPGGTSFPPRADGYRVHEDNMGPKDMLSRVLFNIVEKDTKSSSDMDNYRPPQVSQPTGFPPVFSIRPQASPPAPTRSRPKRSRFAIELARRRKREISTGGGSNSSPGAEKDPIPAPVLAPVRVKKSTSPGIQGLSVEQIRAAQEQIHQLLSAESIAFLQSGGLERARQSVQDSRGSDPVSDVSTRDVSTAKAGIDGMVTTDVKSRPLDPQPTPSVFGPDLEYEGPSDPSFDWTRVRVDLDGKVFLGHFQQNESGNPDAGRPLRHTLAELVALSRSSTVAQQTAALTILRSLLRRARGLDGGLGADARAKPRLAARVVKRLMRLGLLLVLRVALDEQKHYLNLKLAVDALSALLGSDDMVGAMSRNAYAEGLWGGAIGFALAPHDVETVPFDAGQDDGASKTATDMKQGAKDVVGTLVERMDLLGRIAFILGTLVSTPGDRQGSIISPPVRPLVMHELTTSCLRLLRRVAAHSSGVCEAMAHTPKLAATLARLATPRPGNPRESSAFERAAVTAAGALAVLRTMMAGSQAVASDVCTRHGVAHISKGWLLLSASAQGVPVSDPVVDPVVESLRLWQVCICYEMDTGAFLTFAKSLVQTTKSVPPPPPPSAAGPTTLALRFRATYNVLIALARVVQSRAAGGARNCPVRWSHLAPFLDSALRQLPRLLSPGGTKSDAKEGCAVNETTLMAAGLLSTGLMHLLATSGEARADAVARRLLRASGPALRAARNQAEVELKALQNRHFVGCFAKVRVSSVSTWAQNNILSASRDEPSTAAVGLRGLTNLGARNAAVGSTVREDWTRLATACDWISGYARWARSLLLRGAACSVGAGQPAAPRNTAAVSHGPRPPPVDISKIMPRDPSSADNAAIETLKTLVIPIIEALTRPSLASAAKVPSSPPAGTWGEGAALISSIGRPAALAAYHTLMFAREALLGSTRGTDERGWVPAARVAVWRGAVRAVRGLCEQRLNCMARELIKGIVVTPQFAPSSGPSSFEFKPVQMKPLVCARLCDVYVTALHIMPLGDEKGAGDQSVAVHTKPFGDPYRDTASGTLLASRPADQWVANAVPGYGWLFVPFKRRWLSSSGALTPDEANRAAVLYSDLMDMAIRAAAGGLDGGTGWLKPTVARALVEVYRVSSDAWSAPSVARRTRALLSWALAKHQGDRPLRVRAAQMLNRMEGFTHPQWGPFYPVFGELCDRLAFDGLNEPALESLALLFATSSRERDYRIKFWSTLGGPVLARVRAVPPLPAAFYLSKQERDPSVIEQYMAALERGLGRYAEYATKGTPMPCGASCVYQIAVHHTAMALWGARQISLLRRLLTRVPKAACLDVLFYIKSLDGAQPLRCASQGTDGEYHWTTSLRGDALAPPLARAIRELSKRGGPVAKVAAEYGLNMPLLH